MNAYNRSVALGRPEILCPGDHALAAFAEGLQGPVVRDRIEAHLDACAMCRVVVAAAADSDRRCPVGVPLSCGDYAGRYRLAAKLGEGGMGVVFAARDPELGRNIAIKVLRSDVHHGRGHEALVIREARALARLSHPYVVSVFDVGRCDGGVFIAMELVEGCTLRQWWRGRPWQEVVACFHRAGLGLAAAHATGLIHRDFKPENVLLAEDGRPRVGDFGLAAALDKLHSSDVVGPSGGHDGAAPRTTRLGGIVGTPPYMAPELFRGQGASEASDQFSFCVALFEALYGIRPFPPPAPEVPAPAQAPAKVTSTRRRGPTALLAVLHRGLSWDPADRFPSMRALLGRLQAVHGQRKRRIMWIGGAAGAIAAGFLLAPRATPADAWCDGDAAVLWTPETRSRVRARLAGDVDPLAVQSIDKIDDRIARFVEAWGQSRAALCEDASPGLNRDRGMRCLDGQRQALRAAIAVLLEEATPAAAAFDVTRRLEAPAACADPAALADASAPPPPPPELEAEVRELQGMLVEGEALLWAARSSDALALADDMAGRLERLAYPPVVAHAMFLRGACLVDLHRAQAGPEALEAAYDYSLEHGVDDIATRAALSLMKTQGAYFGRLDQAERWARHARALTERTGSDIHTAEYLLEHARALEVSANHAEAIAAVERARDLFAQAGQTKFVISADVLHGTIAYGQQESELARQYYERAMEASIGIEGVASPMLAAPLAGLLNIALDQGDLEEAEFLLEVLDALTRATYGTDHPRHALNLMTRASIADGRGDPDAALVALHAALRVLDKSGEAHPQYVYVAYARIAATHRLLGDRQSAHEASGHAFDACHAYNGLASTCAPESLNHLAWDELNLRQFPEAIDHYQQATEAWEALLGRDTVMLVYPLFGRGLIEMERGNWAGARDWLERGLARTEHDRSVNWPDTAFALARAIWADPAADETDRNRAVQLARDAADLYAARADSAGSLQDVTRWLETL